MERKFYTNDFEQLLKENADQFKMSPSKKVWRGIYNDIHPGTRWPSIAISLLFVFTLILVGYLNIEQSQRTPLANIKENSLVQKNEDLISAKKAIDKTPSKITPVDNKATFTGHDQGKEQIKVQINQSRLTHAERPNFKNINTVAQNNPVESGLPVSATGTNFSLGNGKITDQKDINGVISGNIPGIIKVEEATAMNSNIIGDNISTAITFTGSPAVNNEPLNNMAAVNNQHPGGKNKIATFSHLKMHRNAKISWAYYLSPGISYRLYSKQGNSADQALLGYTNSLTNLNLSKAVTHIPAPGLEAGTMMKYSLTKKLKFTSGLQINYSAYTIQANNIHPIIATLILHSEKSGISYPFTSISYFGNGPGNVPVNLHNYSVQLSLPLGLEYQLAGNDHVQFSIAGSFQPSFVVANKAYILSTDKRNYLTDPSLGRNVNMGTNIGTFISFNSNKFKWQIGPQVRYQLLSSYGNEYQVREHYIDYGIRFGISRIVK